MVKIEQHIRRIIEANGRNGLAVFVGAGISKSSESDHAKIPDWGELVGKLKTELGAVSETDYLKIAQMYYIKFGPKRYYEAVKSHFAAPLAPSDIHRMILQINPPVIITTNWDDLLEQTVRNEGYLYDIVASDRELVESTLPRKIVKMHGDFAHGNIVFKEDDYINYQRDFPLTENFVKSILSTHTILFIGYSYNDMNLKQILMWIKNHSKVRPSMYMTVLKNDPLQSRYLKNHNITALPLKDCDADAAGNSEPTRRMATFLSKILRPEKAAIGKVERFGLLVARLRYLAPLRTLLREHISNCLSPCRYEYADDGSVILVCRQLNDLEEVFNDNNHSTVKLVSEFYNILGRAQIGWIKFANGYKQVDCNDCRNSIRRLLDFDFGTADSGETDPALRCLDKAYGDMMLGNYERSLDSLNDAASICSDNGDYAKLLVCLHNRNRLIRYLQYRSFGRRFDLHETSMAQRFSLLPKSVREVLDPVWQFVDGDMLYRHYFKAERFYEGVENSVETVKRGGVSLNAETERYHAEHENMLFFAAGNRIMVDDKDVFCKLNRRYIEIAVARQFDKPCITFGKSEICACIRYLKDDELYRLILNRSNDNPTLMKLSGDDTAWLVDTVAKNIIDAAVATDCYDAPIVGVVRSLLAVLAMASTNEEQGRTVADYIKRLLRDGNNDIATLDAIRMLFLVRVDCHKQHIGNDVMTEVVDAVIEKLAGGRISFAEYSGIIAYQCLDKIFHYAETQYFKYGNVELLRSLLEQYGTDEVEKRFDLAKYFLFTIFEIGDDAVRQLLKAFFESMDVGALESTDSNEILLFKLKKIFYLSDEGLLDDVAAMLSDAVQRCGDGRSFSSLLYAIDYYVGQLALKYDELKDLSCELSRIVENHNRCKAFYKI